MPINKRGFAGRFDVRLVIGASDCQVQVWADERILFLSASFQDEQWAEQVFEEWLTIVRSNMVSPMGAIEMIDAMKAVMERS